MRGGKPLFLGGEQGRGRGHGHGGRELPPVGHPQRLSYQLRAWLGIGDLLDGIAEALPAPPESVLTEEEQQAVRDAEAALEAEAPEEDGEVSGEDLRPLHRTHGEFEQYETSVAIIGRPNVGKSTLLNALTGTSRAIVSPIAGTTRDAVDEVVEFEGSNCALWIPPASAARARPT